MTNPTKSRRWFTAPQNAEAVERCLQEVLSYNAMAQPLGLPTSSLTQWGEASPVLSVASRARMSRGCSPSTNAPSSWTEEPPGLQEIWG
ncbi:MAG: hypothetical protein ER33_11820 [Cyanobium sp. CACIAM 14]|nr:MAG: hypothetical protein ER33_11820 [Cyanobium sp. CACIAM 14]